jgi:cytochrome P450/NADPH-cytochrome P450 reductase
MHLVLSCIIQKFDLQLADPSSYTLHVKSSLTIKPHVRVRAIPRAGRQVQMVLPAPSSSLRETRDGLAPREGMTQDTSKQRMYVLYGSNTGSCESFAQKIATAAPSHGGSYTLLPSAFTHISWVGFSAKLFSMDAATAALPTDGPVIIISASYEGNASALGD